MFKNEKQLFDMKKQEYNKRRDFLQNILFIYHISFLFLISVSIKRKSPQNNPNLYFNISQENYSNLI